MAYTSNSTGLLAELAQIQKIKSPEQLTAMAERYKQNPAGAPLIAAALVQAQKLKDRRSSMLASGILASDKAGSDEVPVVDEAINSMASRETPEESGIARIPAPNIANMAEGGIVAFAGGNKVESDPVQDFATQYKPIADQVGAELDVDPGLILAQWGHETGWGKGIPGKYNLGNIKGKGASAYDKIEKSSSQYKNYNSPEEFAADYVSQMKRNWPGVIGAKQDVGAFTAGLEKGRLGKYATDEGYGKKLAKAFTKALPFSSAQAADTAPPAADISPEAGATATGAGLAALPAAAGAAYAAKEVGNPFMRSLGLLKQGTPKLLGDIPLKQVTGRMAAGAAAVPAAVGAIGADLSRGAANALSNATPEQLEMLQNDIGSDTGVAAAIMNPANRGPEVTAKQMPYGQQMKNALGFIGKAAVLHPDVTGQAKPAEAERVPFSTGEYRGKSGDVEEDIGPAQARDELPLSEKKMIGLAKEAIPASERKGWTDDMLMQFFLSMMAGQSPNALANIGAAGLSALKYGQEAKKAELEREKDRQAIRGSEAEARYKTAQAKSLESEEKTDARLRIQAATLAQKELEDWQKENFGATPAQVAAKRQELFSIYTAALRQQDTMGAGGTGFKVLGSRQP